MEQKYVVLFTRNLNSSENFQQAVSALSDMPGVCEVRRHESDEPASLSTRLVVVYSSGETSPNMLANELNSMGFPVVMQEELGTDALPIDPSRGVQPESYATNPGGHAL